MGSKRVIDYDEYIVATSMTSTITGDSTNILHTDRVSYQIAYTGTPNGTFSVQVSNDETTWEDLTLSVAIAAIGSADNHFIDAETAAKFVRLVYTASSSTGTLDVKLTAKSISG
tara:strand:+ start:231 stop:572 length:342 start_codon:yes stop_codon:yes gene_type:complete